MDICNRIPLKGFKKRFARKNKKEFRVGKIINRKGDKLSFKW